MHTHSKLMLAAGLMLLAACAPGGAAIPEGLGGRWDVQQIAGASLDEGIDQWIEIDAATGAISGFTGCNAFSATMSAFSESLAIGAVREDDGVARRLNRASTRRGCWACSVRFSVMCAMGDRWN